MPSKAEYEVDVFADTAEVRFNGAEGKKISNLHDAQGLPEVRSRYQTYRLMLRYCTFYVDS